MRKTLIFVLLLVLLVPFGAQGQDDRLQIVASHSILADVVRNVTGDAADVASTMPIGADPHTFEPVPSDLTALANADVVFTNGALFEEGLLEAIENAGEEMNIVEASSCVNIIPFGAASHEHDDDEHEGEEGEHAEGEESEHEGEEGEHAEGEESDAHDDEHSEEMGEMSAIAELCETHYAEMEALHEDNQEHSEDGGPEEGEHAEGEENDHEHSHSEVETLGPLYAIDCSAGHGHEDEEEHSEEEGEEHDHTHGACDPHVWMEPHNVMYWTMLIRDTLVELDPANAETYSANAAAYLEEVDALSHDFIMPLVDTLPDENRILITNHDSLGYLAARHGFEIVGTIFPGGATAADPSAQEVAALIDLIREEGVPAIFGETTVTDTLVQTIADETGAQVFVLYSGSLSAEGEPAATYVDYIRYNYTTIVEALGGGM